MVVDTSNFPEPLKNSAKKSSFRNFQRLGGHAALRQKAAKLFASLE